VTQTDEPSACLTGANVAGPLTRHMRETNPIIRFVTAIVAVLLCLLTATAAVAAPGPDNDPDDVTGVGDLADITGLPDVAGVPDVADPPRGQFPDEALNGSQNDATGSSSAAAALGRPRIFSGWGFDTCHTPTTRTMRAWLHSDYRAVGVYYAGPARACRKQPHLTRGWVRSADRMGWHILPIYVGSQSPCAFSKAKRKHRISRRHPWRQGTAEARDAVSRAAGLGFAPRSPLYLDMEAYSVTRARCTTPTLSFVRAWNRHVRAAGYLPGFYSSSDSGIAQMSRARAAGIPDMPSVIWFARWRVPPTVHREPMLSPGAWQPHRRIHQYSGNVKERHGGRQLHIDRNRMDAPVAIVSG
jgi:hypothetical protein